MSAFPLSDLNLEGLTDAQLRLFAVLCARRAQRLVTTYPERRFILADIRSSEALDVAERHAKGDATDEELAEAHFGAKRAAEAAHKRVAEAHFGAKCAAEAAHKRVAEAYGCDLLRSARIKAARAARAAMADAAVCASRIQTPKTSIASSALAAASHAGLTASLVAEANTAHKSNLSSWTAGRDALFAEEAKQREILDIIRSDGAMTKKNVEKSQTESAARRERIATVVLGMIAQTGRGYAAGSAREAVEFADALIEELDNEKQ